jgi:hypothetical protein
MATEVDWGSWEQSEPAGGNAGSKTQFIKFKSGDKKTLRPIGGTAHFFKIFCNGRTVTVDPEFKDAVEEKVSQALGEPIRANERWAINVVDRSDKKVKILEGGKTIFQHFGMWSANHDKASPGGKQGWDWSIAATGEKLERRYMVQPVGPTPFKPDEIKLAQDSGYDLMKIYEGMSVDKCVEILTSGNPSENSSGSQSQPVGVEEKEVAMW